MGTTFNPNDTRGSISCSGNIVYCTTANTAIRTYQRTGNCNKYYFESSASSDTAAWIAIGLASDTLSTLTGNRFRFGTYNNTNAVYESDGNNGATINLGALSWGTEIIGFGIDKINKIITIYKNGVNMWSMNCSSDSNLLPLFNTNAICAIAATGTATDFNMGYSFGSGNYLPSGYSWWDTISQSPSVSISSNRTYTVTDTTTITYSGSDPEGDQIRFQGVINGVGQGWTGFYNSPQSNLTWGIGYGSLNVGNNTIYIQCQDTVGNTTNSNSVSINRILSPTAASITTDVGTTTENSTYYVFANGVSNASTVKFPTWTETNGQDDLIWHQGIYDSANNRWYYQIKKSEHGNLLGNYITHAYGYDIYNNGYYMGAYTVNVIAPNVAPVVSISSTVLNTTNRDVPINISISDANSDTIKYRVLVNGTERQAFTSLAAQPVNATYTILNSILNTGSNTVQIESQDEHGLSTYSNTLTITKTTFSLTVSSPTTNQLVSNTLGCSGSVIDNDVISKVEVYINGVYKADATLGTNTWSYNLNTSSLTNGNNTIYVKSYCLYGNHTSSTITFSVDNEILPTNTLSVNRISTINETVTVSGIINDANLTDTIKYKISLNGVTKSNWTSLLTQPVNISYTFDAIDFTPINNTITIDIQDSRGGSTSWSQIITTSNRYSKYLVKDNNNILTYNNGWSIVGHIPATEIMYETYGLDSVNIPNTAWFELSNPKLLMARFGTSNELFTANMSERKKSQLFISKSIIDFTNISKFKRVELNDNIINDGYIGIIVSLDEGITWKSFKNNEWVEVDINNLSNNCITKAQLSAIIESKWIELLEMANSIKFGYYIDIGTYDDYTENYIESLIIYH